ncbi:carbonic anhydrase-related protein 10-like [Brevipalpus obovatus]|uniref:carbonic anhydrase-related protein 10-like n=1 Tax=Brevipalpus obovatus TaxID=246614 RepID=UPI003D9F125A
MVLPENIGLSATLLLCFVWFLSLMPSVDPNSWDLWWTYDGISGPDFWGMNKKWSHCALGRKQSPIDINPDALLFDPGLEAIQIRGDLLQGKLHNNGRRLELSVPDNASLVITSGPLSYQYSINHIVFHYGREPDRGSEHTINGISFAGEIQLYFYNSQLYHNWSQAAQESNGLAAIAVLIQTPINVVDESGHNFNSQLKKILQATEHIRHRDSHHTLEAIDVRQLLPTLDHYVTYEGSLTEPPCHETVQWIVLNKPIYVTDEQLSIIRNSINIDGDNFRPLQATNYRCVRTNIMRNFNKTFDEVPKIGDNQKNLGKRLCGNKGYVTYKANFKKQTEVL